MSNIEKISVFNSIRAYLSEQDQSDLLVKLGLHEKNLISRIEGLKVEDEFCLILQYLNTCKHILSFNEGISVLTASYQPDLLLKLNNDKLLFIEIKNAPDKTFKISGGNLDKRIEFAEDFGFPLYFAIKLGAYWTLYHSDFLQTRNGKIFFDTDFELSEFNSIFDSQFCIFPTGIQIESEFSPSREATSRDIKHKDFGTLISYKLSYNNKSVVEWDETKDSAAIYYLPTLQCLIDAMSAQSRKIRNLKNGNTLVVDSLIHNLLLCDYQFFRATVHHLYDPPLGYLHDSTTFFKKFLEDRKQLIKKEHFGTIIQLMKGIPIEVTDNPNYRIINPET